MGELTGRGLKARLTPKPSSPVVADLGTSARGMTRNDDSTGLSNSSSAFPEDFLRVKALGMKFGMVNASETARCGWMDRPTAAANPSRRMRPVEAAHKRIDRSAAGCT